MTPSNGKIIVEVNINQKQKLSVNGNDILLAKEFSDNRRESNPVVCKCTVGNDFIKKGTFLLVHHNRFVENSPQHIGDNIYSLPYNNEIFAKLDANGNAKSICNNIIVQQVFDDYSTLIPPHLRKPNKCKYKVLNTGFGYKKGQTIFCFPFSNYEIVYIWEGVEKRVIKVKKLDIVGKITS